MLQYSPRQPFQRFALASTTERFAEKVAQSAGEAGDHCRVCAGEIVELDGIEQLV